MKMINPILLVAAVSYVTLSVHAQSLLPGDITNNVSPTYTTPDGHLTIEGFSDLASSTPANLTTGGSPASWFGVEANGSLMNSDTMTLQLAPGIGLSGFGRIYTRAVISISGFTADPGFAVVGTDPNFNSSSYNSGVLSVDLGWDNGASSDFTLSNLGASAGQTLTISMDYATGPQFAITHLDYGVAPVPEPGSLALSLIGGTLALCYGWRKRS